jgi:hypothetical protein
MKKVFVILFLIAFTFNSYSSLLCDEESVEEVSESIVVEDDIPFLEQKPQKGAIAYLQEKDISRFCIRFLDLINAEKFKVAFNFLDSYSIMEKYESKQARVTIKQMIRKASVSGACLGVEALLEKKAGNLAKKMIYILKYTKRFLKFEFIFYSPTSEDKWSLYGLKVTDDIEELFDIQ